MNEGQNTELIQNNERRFVATERVENPEFRIWIKGVRDFTEKRREFRIQSSKGLMERERKSRISYWR